MNSIWKWGLLTGGLLLGGCAQMVWTRPGATTEEARADHARCDYESLAATPQSNFQAHGQRGLSRVMTEAIVGGLDEAFRKARLMDKCMVASGYYKVPAQQLAQAPLPQPARAVIAAPSAVAAPVEVAAQPVPGRQGPEASILAVRYAPAPAPQARVTSDEADRMRFLVTNRMMKLPDRSPQKTAFLLGACSAGDLSACTLSELLSDRRRPDG